MKINRTVETYTEQSQPDNTVHIDKGKHLLFLARLLILIAIPVIPYCRIEDQATLCTWRTLLTY